MKHFLAVLLFAWPTLAAAQDHWESIQPYLNDDDVVAVAYLDLSQIDTLGVLEFVEKLGADLAPKDRGQATQFMLQAQTQLDRLADFGAQYVYVLFRVSDLANHGPTWVVPVSEAGDPRAVMGMILSGRPDQMEIERDLRPSFFPDFFEASEGAVLGANSEEQLDMLKASRSPAKRDLDDAWQALGTGHCGLIVFGNADSRRVVRELFPQLPVPFQQVDGRLIADGMKWGGVLAKLPPEPSLQVLVQANEESQAVALQSAINVGLAVLKTLPFAQKYLIAEDLNALTESLKPGVSGSQLAILFDDVLGDVDRIARLLTPPVNAARKDVQRDKRMNQFKQILLAMHNYHSAKGTFPPRSTFDEAGKPLLSWRVHILPYLDQSDLYQQFHLDEPWDSEHNKQLIPLMPEVYADPDPAIANRTAIGRTPYVVPTGPGTVFEHPEGTSFKAITDGTSNTIMLVEIWSMAGPYWTQPKDWLVDSAMPWERLQRRDDRTSITTGFCDGHALMLPTSTSNEKLRALITCAGGEVITWP